MQAQDGNAQLSGAVTDSTGAAITKAQLTIQNTGTGLVLQGSTDSAGEYRISTLPPGEYKLTAKADGFTLYNQTGIKLTVGQFATLNIALKPGSASESVTVTGDAEQINATNAEISQIVDEDTIKDLPLNGRDPSALVSLSAGVVNELYSHASTPSGSNGFPTETGASAAGGRQGSTWYLLDGVSNMDTYSALADPFPNADATQEFRVISNNYDAHYGFAAGAVVLIQTKSGSNQFHGGLFEFVRNTDLNAADYFGKTADALRRNQFGGFVGGPILRDKLFFFTNYQGTRHSWQTSPGENITYTPTQAMLNGDFSALPAGELSLGSLSSTIYHTVNGVPNQVDTSLYSKGALEIAKLLPLGQDAATGKTTFTQPNQTESYDENTSRLDYDINDRQRVFLRSFLYNYNKTGATIPGDILAGGTAYNGTYLNIVGGHTWTLSPSLINSATLAWSEYNYVNGTQLVDASGKPICMSQFVNVNDPPGACYFAGISAQSGNPEYGESSGFSTFASTPTIDNRRDIWFTDTVTKTLGKHMLTAGVDIMHRYGYENISSQYASMDFTGTYAGSPLADFLLGDLYSFSQATGNIGSVSGYMSGYYFQDQFKLSPTLTVTAGLRWEPEIPASVKGGRAAAWVPGQQSTRYTNAPVGLVYPGDKGISDRLFSNSYGYFQPRVGFAWQALPKTVVRAGFGMFTTPMEDAFYENAYAVAPFAPSYSPNGGTTTPLAFDNPWSTFAATDDKSPFPPFPSPSYTPSSNVAISTGQSLGAVFKPNLKLGLASSWNLSIDHQVTPNIAAHIAYVGNMSYHMATPVEQNPGSNAIVSCKGTPCPSGARGNANFGSIKEVLDGGTGKYQSLQASVDKRISYHLQLHSNFTWGKTYDVGGSGDPSWEASVSDPRNIRHDYGRSSLNFPFAWATSFVYQLPTWKTESALSSGIAKALVNGWEFTGSYIDESGNPVSIHGGPGKNNSGFNIGQDRADWVPGQKLEQRKGGKSHWLNQYFNPKAFTENAIGTPGNTEKFIIQLPPTATADLALIKNWTLRESYKLQFRWEAFNALNHPSFGAPDTYPQDSNFGQISSTGNVAARVMQGALKLTF